MRLEDLREALAVYPEMHGFPRYEFEECATVEAAAQAYLGLQEGRREPDYAAAVDALAEVGPDQPLLTYAVAAIDAAIGGMSLVNRVGPPIEEER